MHTIENEVLTRFEKQVKSGRLTKANINNKGYNKYLKLSGDVVIEIDYEKYNQDQIWDGLKGYITNTKLTDSEVIENYKNLWHIEKAFRMSKTDLRIRPIYHRLRTESKPTSVYHLLLIVFIKNWKGFCMQEKSTLSLKRAAEVTHNMYQITYTLPESKHTKSKLLNMDEEQTELYQIITEKFLGCCNAENRRTRINDLGKLIFRNQKSLIDILQSTNLRTRINEWRILINSSLSRIHKDPY